MKHLLLLCVLLAGCTTYLPYTMIGMEHSIFRIFEPPLVRDEDLVPIDKFDTKKINSNKVPKKQINTI